MKSFSRRDFLKLSALGLGGLALRPLGGFAAPPAFPEFPHLGRVAVGKVDVMTRPDWDSQVSSVLYQDAVVEWLREVVGRVPYRTNQRWVETPIGYIWSPHLQPVRNQPNLPLSALPDTSLGPGMWCEISQPYANLLLDNPPARSPALKETLELGLPPRLYYSQVVWVDRVRVDEQGQTWYRVNEKYGSYGDIYWARADAFRPITAEEIEPIHPEAEEKRVVVDVTYQTLSCFEGRREVFFARVSTGALFDAWGNRVDVWATPAGNFPIWRKLVSLHMSGGTTGGGWDLPGVGWVSLFVGSGVAVHATYWHSNFGEPMSRGCINARPEDARWVFRWTAPVVAYDPGDASVGWPGGTMVEVKQS
jgi:lipoprotein-anchoring transpeptidase ErfK/SrfK